MPYPAGRVIAGGDRSFAKAILYFNVGSANLNLTHIVVYYMFMRLFKLIGPTLGKCLQHLHGSITSPDPLLAVGEGYANRTSAVCPKANISSSTNSSHLRY